MADDSDGYGGFTGGNYGFSGTPSGGSGLSLGGGNVGLGTSSNLGNYGLSTNYGFSNPNSQYGGNGLTVGNSTIGGLGELGSTNYGFGGLGSDYGFNAGGYNLGGNLGQSLGTLADISRYPTSPVNYGFSSPSATDYTGAGRPNLGFTGMGNEGLHALASTAPGYTLSQGITGKGISGNDKETSGWDHPAVKFMRTILGFTPYGALANLGINAVQGKDVGSSLIGMAVPGMNGAIAGSIYNAARSDNPTASALTSGAGILGGILGGQAGSQALGTGANAVMQRVSADNQAVGAFGQGSPMQAGVTSAQTTPDSIQGGGTNWSNIATLLGKGYGAYTALNNANQVASNAAGVNSNLQSSMAGLSDMYSPTGAYAQQLQQELARRDAKAGRNSQYGPRSVELQAALAKMQAQAAQSQAGLANAATSASAATQKANDARLQTLGQLFSAATDKNTRGQISNAWGDLKGLFSSNTNTPVAETPTYSDNSLYSLFT